MSERVNWRKETTVPVKVSSTAFFPHEDKRTLRSSTFGLSFENPVALIPKTISRDHKIAQDSSALTVGECWGDKHVHKSPNITCGYKACTSSEYHDHKLSVNHGFWEQWRV